MRLGSRDRRQGDRRNRQMFFEAAGRERSCLSERDQAINAHRKRESQRDVSGCKNFVRTSLNAYFPEHSS